MSATFADLNLEWIMNVFMRCFLIKPHRTESFQTITNPSYIVLKPMDLDTCRIVPTTFYFVAL
jgi:hypothetical protein